MREASGNREAQCRNSILNGMQTALFTGRSWEFERSKGHAS
jgi:hypothetical protein